LVLFDILKLVDWKPEVYVGIEHVEVGLYGLLGTLRWITKITILQAEEQMLD